MHGLVVRIYEFTEQDLQINNDLTILAVVDRMRLTFREVNGTAAFSGVDGSLCGELSW